MERTKIGRAGAWRSLGRKLGVKINSPGKFTRILSALNQASKP
jgi:hypothetical protein